MAVEYKDPQAARLLRIVLETAEKMAARSAHNGPIVLPHETNFPSTQGFVLEGAARAYLLIAAHGEGPESVSEEQLWRDLHGRHVFKFGQFALQRSDRAIASFSWGRQIMGLCVPMDKDLVVTPCDRGMIGYVKVDGISDKPTVKRVVTPNLGDAFGVIGILDRGSIRKSTTKPRSAPIAEQRFAFVALPDGTTVYVDRFVPLTPDKPSSVELGTVGVLNDVDWVWHGGKRTLFYDDGRTLFKAADAPTQPRLNLHSKWLNMDDKLGIVCLSSAGQSYIPQSNSNRGRLEQLLHLNVVPPEQLSRGHPSQTAIVFFPQQSADQTKLVSEQCRIDSSDSAPMIIRLPQHLITVDFEKLSVSLQKK
jgi:hypothetical protein